MKRSMAGIPAALTTLALLVAALPAAAGEPTGAAGGRNTTDARAATVTRAADAHAEAVARAADAVVEATRLELDIRLVGLTSVQVANDLR